VNDGRPAAEWWSAAAEVRELTAQGGNKVTIRLDAHRYAVAEALAKAQRETLPQLAAEALDLAIARGSTR
jgi:hypothetical protein